MDQAVRPGAVGAGAAGWEAVGLPGAGFAAAGGGPGMTVRENCASGVSTRGRAGPGAMSEVPGVIEGRLESPPAAGRPGDVVRAGSTEGLPGAAPAPVGGSVETATGCALPGNIEMTMSWPHLHRIR
jgi:hypothetical protein